MMTSNTTADDFIFDHNCSDCNYFNKDDQKCSISKGSPIRSCVIGINRNFCKRVEENAEILEIGCGSWSYLKDRLPESAYWYGIDVIDTDIVTKVGSVGDIPYDLNRFDYVISNQSMEHWHEFGVPLQRGLSEISRVLKTGGEAWLNVPIHLHGHSIFIEGDMDNIYRLIKEDYWDVINLEEWRKNYEPLDAYYPYDDRNLSNDAYPANRPSTWILNIVIEKKIYTTI